MRYKRTVIGILAAAVVIVGAVAAWLYWPTHPIVATAPPPGSQQAAPPPPPNPNALTARQRTFLDAAKACNEHLDDGTCSEQLAVGQSIKKVTVTTTDYLEKLNADNASKAAENASLKTQLADQAKASEAAIAALTKKFDDTLAELQKKSDSPKTAETSPSSGSPQGGTPAPSENGKIAETAFGPRKN